MAPGILSQLLEQSPTQHSAASAREFFKEDLKNKYPDL